VSEEELACRGGPLHGHQPQDQRQRRCLVNLFPGIGDGQAAEGGTTTPLGYNRTGEVPPLGGYVPRHRIGEEKKVARRKRHRPPPLGGERTFGWICPRAAF